MSLFGRQVVVQIGTEGSTGREFRDLRVTFRVEMTTASTPNKAVVALYNPAPESVALAQAKGCIVRLLAGYDAPALIFQGNPVRDGVRLDRGNVDRVLTLDLQDGGRRLQSARVSLELAAETTLRQVVDATVAATGLTVGRVEIPSAAADVRYPSGFSYAGPAQALLDRLAQSAGADWFVRDGVVWLLPATGSTREAAVLLSATRGNLIGSPVPKDKGRIEATTLLDPAVRPGRPFRVESERYNGDYVAEAVIVVGDTHGQDWYTVATGRAA